MENGNIGESEFRIEDQERNKELELKDAMNDIEEKSIQKRDPFELKERSQSMDSFEFILIVFRV